MDYKKLAADFLAVVAGPGKVKKGPNAQLKSNDFALFYIIKAGEAVPKDISESFNISSARVAKVLNELESDGLVTREIDPMDRRRILVRPTEKGKVRAKFKHEELINKISYLLEGLGINDALEYIRISRRISEIMKSNEHMCDLEEREPNA